jgi:hypothetical protein
MTHCPVNHHIIGHLVFVLVSTDWVMVCPAVDNPANWEIRAVIRSVHAKDMNAAECTVSYAGQNVMSEGTVRQWCRMCKDGRTNAHDVERSGRPSVVSDDLSKCWQKISEKRRFTILELSFEFSQISRTLLYEIIVVTLNYHKFCARWIPRMLTDAHKTQRRASALTF